MKLVLMELTGNAQSHLCPEGAVVLQGAVAQVAARISGRHLRDVQGPVRQQGQPRTGRRGPQLRTATANNYPSVFRPGGRPRRQDAAGGTRKSHDVTGCDRQSRQVGTFGPKRGCDEPRDGETSTVRRPRRPPPPCHLEAGSLKNSPVVHKHACSKDRIARIIVVEFQVTSSSTGENKWLPVQTCLTSPPV